MFDSFVEDCGATIVGVIISTESVPEENGFKVDCWKGLGFDWLKGSNFDSFDWSVLKGLFDVL